MRAILRCVGAVLLLGGAVGGASKVSAGARAGGEVYVDTTGRLASGTMGTAYNSTDTTQYIGCLIGTGSYIICFATNRAGVYASCSVAPARYQEFAAIVGSMSSNSSLMFTWDSAGRCQSLDVWNNSSAHHKR